MTLTIQNFRRIAAATIKIAPLTILCGRNGAGKTTILQAFAACKSGLTAPVDGLLKKDAAALVTDGATEATITLDQAGAGTATVTYPAGKRTVEGLITEISATAAGAGTYITDAPKDRIRAINALRDTDPTREHIDAALAPLRLPASVADRLWNTITAQGWDAAHAIARENGTKLKGGWEQITGKRYGSQLAESWLPDGWAEELCTATPESLAAAVTEAETWVASATGAQAVGDEARRRLTETAGKLPALRDVRAGHDAALKACEKDAAAARSEISELESQRETVCECPACHAPVVIQGKALRLPRHDPTSTDLQDRIDRTTATLRDIETQIQTRRAEIGKVDGFIALAEKSEKQLAALRATTPHTGPALADAQARLQSARQRVDAQKRWADAAAKHRGVVQNQAIIDILAPDGLRQSRLAEAIAPINEQLDKLCQGAKWLPVQIEPDTSLTYGGRPYLLSSEAEQGARVALALQVAWSMIEGNREVLLDVKSNVDSGTIRGVIALGATFAASEPGRSVVIAMAADKPVDLKGRGLVYWVEDGKVSEAAQG